MKVALVHDFLNQWGGAERVLDALHELYPDAPVFTLMHDRERTKGHFDTWDIRTSFLQRSWIASARRYALPLYSVAIESFDLTQFDVVISSANSFAKGVLTRPETLHICYCHTPTAYLWSWTYNYLDEQRLGKLTGSAVRLMLHNLRMWDRLAAERVDRWVANSQNVQQRIQKFYRKESEVIYPPVDTDRFHPAKLVGDYFLYISRLSGYKRPGLVVETFNQLGLPLVVIGEGTGLQRLRAVAKENITFTGWLADEEVAQYLSRCRALVFPTEEDFGIVPVEAMAAGRPVIALKRGGALETVVPGKTGLFFNEQGVGALTQAVGQFLEDEQTFNPSAIQKHAQQFARGAFLDRMSRFVEKAWEEYREH